MVAPALAAALQAQNNRSFVATTGSDSNNCAVTAFNYGVNLSGGPIQLANCALIGNSTDAYVVSSGTLTASSPGTNLISGAVSGSLSTASTLQYKEAIA